MANVALFNDYGGPGTSSASYAIAGTNTTIYIGGQFYMTSAQMAAAVGYTAGSLLYLVTNAFHDDGIDLGADGDMIGFNDFSVPAGSFTPDAWHTVEMFWDTSTGSVQMALDTTSGSDTTGPFVGEHITEADIGNVAGTSEPGQGIYVGQVWIGTAAGQHDILLEDWSSGDFSNWTIPLGASATITSPPGVDPPAFASFLGPATPPPPAATGRVLIAFDDGPLEPSPTWTRIDELTPRLVSGYDLTVGRQSLISQTDTGTATVYLNDNTGLFDPRNASSPYFGKLDGRQILLQLYDPVRAVWEEQFRGWIDDYTFDINPALNAAGEPINATIQIDCVDMFDFLAGFGLTPGLDGVTPQVVPSGTAGGAPPAGYEDGVYYAETAGAVEDRILEILADVGIDPAMYLVASGNVRVRAVKYDPDESALQALRDACDAEFPFIANMYCNRHGTFSFRGRYSRFYPDDVAAEPGSQWDFTRWAVGDGPAIQTDPTRAQMRVLGFQRARSNIINVAVGYPQGIAPADMPNAVYADPTSIAAYGKHAAQPMSDLLTLEGIVSGYDDKTECAKFAELLVKNQKDPREAVSSLQLKSVYPQDARASSTWALITQADISHIVNVAVGYPGGTGLAGASPDDDYYIEGRQMRVRPLQSTFDYVELDLEVSPAVWSMDTHGVFPNPFA